MEELTPQEKRIIISIINAAVEGGLIKIEGGAKGGLQTYQVLSHIIAKLLPVVAAESVKMNVNGEIGPEAKDFVKSLGKVAEQLPENK